MTNRNQLSPDELWQRIRDLEGRTVLTLKTLKPNRVQAVTGGSVRVEGRSKPVPGKQVQDAYDEVCTTGEFRVRYGHAGRTFVYSLVPALLLDACPDQLERIGDGGPTGIRLKESFRP